MADLTTILKLDAEISNLTAQRDRLGKQYAEENFPFKKGDRITIERGGKYLGLFESDHWEITDISYGMHSKFKGLAKLRGYRLNEDGTYSGFMTPVISDEFLINVKKFENKRK